MINDIDKLIYDLVKAMVADNVTREEFIEMEQQLHALLAQRKKN